jgi:hypothetical protein
MNDQRWGEEHQRSIELSGGDQTCVMEQVVPLPYEANVVRYPRPALAGRSEASRLDHLPDVLETRLHRGRDPAAQGSWSG